MSGSIDPEGVKKELLQLNQNLIDSIANADYETYHRLCAEDMSCLEPETNHNVVIGKAFHKYYFDVFGSAGTHHGPKTHTQVTMVQPHVQILRGSNSNNNGTPTGAVLSYVKLTQRTTPGQPTVTMQQSETRVWELRGDGWFNIHFHKSPYK